MLYSVSSGLLRVGCITSHNVCFGALRTQRRVSEGSKKQLILHTHLFWPRGQGEGDSQVFMNLRGHVFGGFGGPVVGHFYSWIFW